MQKYCSYTCRRAARIREVACTQCGARFALDEGQIERFNFCAKSCRKLWLEETGEAVCSRCRVTFQTPARDPEQFCSTRCRELDFQEKNRSGLEKRVGDALIARGVQVVPTYQVRGYWVDYAIPERRIAIEVDGDYWHAKEKAQRRDAREALVLERMGWVLIRVRESELTTDFDRAIDALVERIRDGRS